MTPITTEKRITGLIVGNVTQRSRCNGPAPSSSADSYKCLGTSRMAARKMIMMFPTPHSPSITSEGFDQPGDWNHSGPSIPNCFSRMFTGPVAGLRMYTNARVAATGGASAGR
jgi:hypothetical protein